jgi:hypothetical protein
MHNVFQVLYIERMNGKKFRQCATTLWTTEVASNIEMQPKKTITFDNSIKQQIVNYVYPLPISGETLL